MLVCLILHLRNLNDSFLDGIVTCKEKSILYDNCQSSTQSWRRTKHFPEPKLHQQKIMVTVWSSLMALYITPLWNVSIVAEVCCQQMDEIHILLIKMWPTLVNRLSPIFPPENFPSYVARMKQQKLTGYETQLYALHCPVLAHNECYFIKHLDIF